MPTCPFCSVEISEELSLYGGHCTHCLIEIPGEEAVTNPGVAATAEGSAVQGKSRFVGLGVAIGLLAIGGWWMSVEDETRPGMGKFQRSKLAVPLSAHEDQKHVEVSAETKDVAPKPKTPSRRTRQTRSAPVQKAATPAPATETNAVASSSAGLGSAPTDLFSTIGAAPRARGGPKGIVLDDAMKIEQMVSRVLTRGRRDVEECFGAAKASNPSATGAWYVGFTVSTDGKPVGVGIEPLGAANATVEACIQASVVGWRFQRVNEVVQVSDTYRMGG
jgi:hypothetical protein